jgi:NAD-reducing hydrogenase large subunit
MKELLADSDLLTGELTTHGARRDRGVAIIEAPRGTLIHHYEVNPNDQIVRANLIVSTTHNNEAMNQAVRVVADQCLDGQTEISEGMLNSIEVGIRAYDPCLSCATHALGQMRLRVQLVGPDGSILDERTRG